MMNFENNEECLSYSLVDFGRFCETLKKGLVRVKMVALDCFSTLPDHN